MREVAAARCAMSTAGEELAIPGMRMVLGEPVPAVAQLVDAAGEGRAPGQRFGRGRTGSDGDEIEDGERHHG